MAAGSLAASSALIEVVGWGVATVLGLIVATAVYLIAWAASYARVPSDRP